MNPRATEADDEGLGLTKGDEMNRGEIVTEAKLLNVGETDLEITVRMSLSEWRKLLGQVSTRDYPSWQIGSDIADAVRKVIVTTTTRIVSGTESQ